MSEVRAAAAPDLDALALFAGQDAEAVVLDFMQPAWSGWRAVGERWLARANEADREISPPTGRWGAPDNVHAKAFNAAPALTRISAPLCASISTSRRINVE
jgi:hypothetical protein